MNVQLGHSIGPIFAAGFLGTAMIFGGLSVGGPAIGIAAARLLGEPVIEMIASIIGGAVATTLIGRTKS